MYKLVLYILFLNFITINFAYSYIGPGMGGGFIAAIIGIVIALFSLIFGILWLGTLIGWDKPILQLGAFPFLLAELFKILLLTLLLSKIIKLRKFI